MKKIFLLILCIFLIYGILVFIAPKITSNLEESLGFSGTTDKIRKFKNQFDQAITDIPSVEQLKTGAEDVRNTLQESLDTTKGKIDSVRSTFSGAHDTLNQTFETIDGAIETVKTAKETVTELSEKTESLENLGNAIQGRVNTKILSTSSGETTPE